jgi:hypothetical protein
MLTFRRTEILCVFYISVKLSHHWFTLYETELKVKVGFIKLLCLSIDIRFLNRKETYDVLQYTFMWILQHVSAFCIVQNYKIWITKYKWKIVLKQASALYNHIYIYLYYFYFLNCKTDIYNWTQCSIYYIVNLTDNKIFILQHLLVEYKLIISFVSFAFVLITKTDIESSNSLNIEMLVRGKSVYQRTKIVYMNMWNVVISSYSSDSVICWLRLIPLYVAVSVMIWQVVECPMNRHVLDYVFQKRFKWQG